MNQNKDVILSVNLTEKELNHFKEMIQVLGEDACLLSESIYPNKEEKERYVLEAIICYKVLRALGDNDLRSEEDFIALLRERSGINISDIEWNY